MITCTRGVDYIIYPVECQLIKTHLHPLQITGMAFCFDRGGTGYVVDCSVFAARDIVVSVTAGVVGRLHPLSEHLKE